MFYRIYAIMAGINAEETRAACGWIFYYREEMKMNNKHLSRVLSLFLAAAMAFGPCLSAWAAPASAEKAVSVSESGLGYELMQETLKNRLQSFEAYDPDAVVDFIVELEGQALLESKPDSATMRSYMQSRTGKAAIKAIESAQAAVQSRIESDCSSATAIEYTYQVVLNGFAVRTSYSEKAALEAIPGVKAVYVAQTHEYVEPVEGYAAPNHSSGEMMDSDRANAEGYTGKGTVTAILDTGLDVAHAAFDTDPADPAFEQADIAAFVKSGELQAAASADELYVSAKIPFAYDYADGDTDVLGPENHGSHVAGTVGGYDVTDEGAVEFSGVAPDTQLAIMKVFSDGSSGASDTWIFAALEDCVLLGVDTINMSLGTASGFTSASVSDQVYNRVLEAGINLMCAAGNDYDATYMNSLGTDLPLVSEPDNAIVGSPSTYTAAMSVASVNEAKTFASYILAGGRKITFSDTNAGELAFTTALDGQTLEVVKVPGIGDSVDFTEVDVKGKIALVKRGSIAFTEKEQNAAKAGAAAMIVYDNVSGDLINMQLNGLLPAIFVTQEDGEYLAALEDKAVSVSSEYTDYMTDSSSGLMSDFSSLGVAPDLTLKPEITAPGGNVWSTLPGNSYGNMSGTSMASPHMAGAASVLKQYVNEAFTALNDVQKQELVNTLLMNTAVPVEDENGVAYTPRKQGAGLAEVYNAIHTGAYVTVDGSTRPKAELGDSASGYFSKEFTLTVHNVSDSALTYNLSAIPLTAETAVVEDANGETRLCISDHSRVMPESELKVLFSQDSVTVPAGSTAKVTVKLILTETGEEALADFTNGTFLDGFVVLESQNADKIDLSVPYLGFYGDWGAASVFDDSIYGEEEASVYPSTMALFDILTGNGYYLGMNLLADEEIFDANKIAVASRSLGYNRVFSLLGLLRAPKSLTYTVTSADPADTTVYLKESTENVIKSFYYASGGFINYEMGPTYSGWAPVYTDEDGYIGYIPDGDYIYTVTAQVDGTTSPAGTQSTSFPISIDNQKPQLVSTVYEVIDGVPYLTLNLTDNQYLMAFQMISADGNSAYSPAYTVNEDEKGAVTSITFNVSDLQAEGLKTARVAMYDYALNYAESDLFSLVSQDIEPDAVKINSQDITVSSGASPFEIEAYIEPENAVNKELTWSSSNPAVATVVPTGKTRYEPNLGITLYGALVTPSGMGGTAVITAAAPNGVSGSTTVTVISSTQELPEDYIIREDGYYTIPANLNKTVKITENARNVTIAGAAENTAEKPYSGLAFVSEIAEGLNLTIADLNVTASSASVITFAGENDTLTLVGENNIKGIDGRYLSKALINVPQGAGLTINGSGTLNLYVPGNGYGAGIGGDAGKNAGSITVDGGVLNITNYSGGAGIGGGSNGSAEKITINGGVINVDCLLYNSGWTSNLTANGAGIGTGDSVAKPTYPAAVIEINGGEINGSTSTDATVIGVSYGGGSGYGSAAITINGGKLNLKSNAIDSSGMTAAGMDGGVCIGVGSRVSAASTIIINGGEVIAVSDSASPAIGGATGASGGNIRINGGTVTAIANNTSTSYLTPAIGYGSTGTPGTLRINAGTVKAVSANTDAILINGTIINNDAETVYKTTFNAPNVKSVMIDGKDWKVSVNHPDDDTIYLWMAAGKHLVTIETDDGTDYYEVNINANTGAVTINQCVTVTYNLTNLTTDGKLTAYTGKDLTGTLKADSGYQLPSAISAVVSGAEVPVSYSAEDGSFTVAGEYVTGDVTITAAAVPANVDKTELNALIAQVEAMDPAAYTEDSWNALAVELAAAQAVAADETADQDAVDAAYQALLAAVNALAVRADADALNALIAEAEKKVESAYTPDSWAAADLAAAIEAAKAVAADPNATQEDVNAAADALQAALDLLIARADKTALRAAIDEADALFESNYTPESWAGSNIDAALAAAIAVYTDPNASQDEVNAAEAALRTAINALLSLADKTALNELIAMAEALDPADYTADSWSALQAALDAAKAAAGDPNALQTEVDAAAAALQQAIASLVVRGDTTALEALIAQAEALDENAYTPDSWKALEEALAAAKAAVADAGNLTQADVDAFAAALQAALDALVKRADTTALEALIAQAKALNEEEYTPASWGLLQTALEAAEKALDPNATQAEVDQAAALLQYALDNLAKPADKAELGAAVEEGKQYNEEDYTVDSWAAFEDALEAAEKVLEDPNAVQEDVDAALAALKEAEAQLEEAGDPSALLALVETAKSNGTSQYTDESATAIRDAIAKAEAALAKRGTEAELKAAYDALKSAMDNAVLKSTPSTGNTGNTGSAGSSAPASPATGDTAPIMLLFVLFAMSGAVLPRLWKRKENN